LTTTRERSGRSAAEMVTRPPARIRRADASACSSGTAASPTAGETIGAAPASAPPP